MPTNIRWTQVDSLKQNPFKKESTNQSKENMYFYSFEKKIHIYES